MSPRAKTDNYYMRPCKVKGVFEQFSRISGTSGTTSLFTHASCIHTPWDRAMKLSHKEAWNIFLFSNDRILIGVWHTWVKTNIKNFTAYWCLDLIVKCPPGVLNIFEMTLCSWFEYITICRTTDMTLWCRLTSDTLLVPISILVYSSVPFSFLCYVYWVFLNFLSGGLSVLLP